MEWDIFNNVFVRWGKIYFSPVYRYIILLLISEEARTRLSPPLNRGRRPIAEELHRGLFSDTLKALQESPDLIGSCRGYRQDLQVTTID